MLSDIKVTYLVIYYFSLDNIYTYLYKIKAEKKIVSTTMFLTLFFKLLSSRILHE